MGGRRFFASSFVEFVEREVEAGVEVGREMAWGERRHWTSVACHGIVAEEEEVAVVVDEEEESWDCFFQEATEGWRVSIGPKAEVIADRSVVWARVRMSAGRLEGEMELMAKDFRSAFGSRMWISFA
jgi:hypothetical protein